MVPVICCGLISAPWWCWAFALLHDKVTLDESWKWLSWWIIMNNPCSSFEWDVLFFTASCALNSLSTAKWTPSCEVTLNASPAMMIIISRDDNVWLCFHRADKLQEFPHTLPCLMEKCVSRVACWWRKRGCQCELEVVFGKEIKPLFWKEVQKILIIKADYLVQGQRI